MDDLISRSAAINVIERTRAYIGHNMERAVGAAFIEILDDVGKDIGRLPSAQPTFDARDTQYNLPIGTDCISRQAAISAICNACGKIDCDKMDKCEKLQLPPANCSEFPNNSDTISRQAAITEFSCCELTPDGGIDANYAIDFLKQLPSAQPEPKRGKWIYHIDDLFPAESTKECDQCHAEQLLACDDEFCPHCGAKMEVTE